jgi:hypothetical protein
MPAFVDKRHPILHTDSTVIQERRIRLAQHKLLSIRMIPMFKNDKP